jgi:hypothetical protein
VTSQLPAVVKVSKPVEGFTVHSVVPALVTAYVIGADPSAEAATEGVAGDAVVKSAVVGAHVTIWVPALTVTVIVVVALL